MDVFSWFRQKRQGLRPNPAREVAIPLDPTPTIGFVVYFYAGDEAPPEPDAMLRLTDSWLDEHTQEPIRSGIRAFCEQGLLTIQIHAREEIPLPPDEMLRAYGPGEIEERRYRNATHTVFVGAMDLLLPPRIGLWAAIAVSRALTMALPGGVLLDPEFPRLVNQEVSAGDLPGEGIVRVVEHILVPYSRDERSGLLWITTKGMGRFGLPDVELRNAPPNLAQSLMPVINGLAQRLADTAVRAVMEADDNAPPDTLVLPAEFRFDFSDIRRAYDKGDSDPDEMEPIFAGEDAPPGETLVRLEMTGGGVGDEDAPPMVRLLPPLRAANRGSGGRGGTGIWLNTLLSELMGGVDEMALVETDDEAMEAAHHEAVAALPLVRERFRAGFQSGEVLQVKHGFPLENAGHEYMWIAVTGWNDGRIKGTLSNDPQYRPDLRAGQKVEIGEDEVYDWLVSHTDGRMEGAYTNRVLPQDEE